MKPRIVSLLAASTEIVCALGLEDCLVGISHECDFPPSVRQLPACTGPKFQTDGTSYEIDQKVKAIVEQALSVYYVDADLVAALEPTHIITQDQCQVCAVSLKDVEDAACSLIASRPAIVSLLPNNLADIFQDIRRVGAALAYCEEAEALVAKLEERMNGIAFAAAEKTVNRAPARVLFVEWISPLMCGGNWMPTLISMAGGIDLFGKDGQHAPPLDWDDVLVADPQVMIVAPCGFDIARTTKELPSLTQRPGWSQLECVRQNRVFIGDGNQFFNRPGPRIAESLEILYQTIWQTGEIAGRQVDHQGSGWVQVV